MGSFDERIIMTTTTLAKIKALAEDSRGDPKTRGIAQAMLTRLTPQPPQRVAGRFAVGRDGGERRALPRRRLRDGGSGSQSKDQTPAASHAPWIKPIGVMSGRRRRSSRARDMVEEAAMPPDEAAPI